MTSHTLNHLMDTARNIDWYRHYRRLFSLILVLIQVGITWAMWGRFAILTAQIGAVVMPTDVWILMVRLLGVMLVVAPVIDAHAGYGKHHDELFTE